MSPPRCPKPARSTFHTARLPAYLSCCENGARVTSAAQPQPDVTEMVAVHQVFRDTLTAAPKLIGATEADDTSRVALLSNFYSNVLSFLAVHHEGEDELLYPVLLERAGGDRELIERINGQHHDVESLIADAQAALERWGAGDDAARADVAETLNTLDGVLADHLGEEEQRILPLCAEHLSIPEWGALPAHGMAHFGGDKIWLVLGLLRQRMTQDQRDQMLAHMPPPAVEMWTGFGEAAFTELMGQVGPPLG